MSLRVKELGIVNSSKNVDQESIIWFLVELSPRVAVVSI